MMSPGFTGSRLDRIDQARHDAAAVAAMRRDPAALLLDLEELFPVGAGDSGLLGWKPLTGTEDEAEMALLGLIDGRPRFVALERDVSAFRRSPELFAAISAMSHAEAGTYAAARSLVDWHARHRFCARCGRPTLSHRGGWGRRCPDCEAEHFPRVDPVVIMIAQHGEGEQARALVGRQASFAPGRYSALAGFLEPGESIEEAVAREVLEEAGLAIHSVRYLASQPWPFPAQLMIACIGLTDDDRLEIDRNELEDAMWVSRAEVRAALERAPAARFDPPAPYAIAHTLLRHWAMA